jgi:hypothetical protein
VSKFEQQVNETISRQVINLSDNPPLMTTAFKTSLHILPPQFDAIAGDIYDSFDGSNEGISILRLPKHENMLYFRSTNL